MPRISRIIKFLCVAVLLGTFCLIALNSEAQPSSNFGLEPDLQAKRVPLEHPTGTVPTRTSQVNQQNTFTIGLLAGLSCPSTTICFAIGSSGTIMGTTNGGLTWATQSFGVANYLRGISCPSTTTCIAVGGDFRSGIIMLTTNGGATWSDNFDSYDPLFNIDCPSTTTCFVVSGYIGYSKILFTTNGGVSWSAKPVNTTTYLSSISCPSTTTCFAAASSDNSILLVTTNGGTSWSTRHIYTNYIFEIKCPSLTTCFTISQKGEIGITKDGGISWIDYKTGIIYLRGITCPSPTTCFVIGDPGTILVTNDGGTKWFRLSHVSDTVKGITCPSPSTCFTFSSKGTLQPLNPQCFAETGYCLEGRVKDYWQENGGLPVFGFPITNTDAEINRDLSKTYPTQWLQRNRFELHPEKVAPYDVLLGRLGDERLNQLGIDWKYQPKATGPRAGCLWFAETQHNICDQVSGLGFKTYWQTHGLQFPGQSGITYAESLALFGLPLTESRLETNTSGENVETQWFERARFEWHPDKPSQYKILLGLLGNEVHAR